MSLYGLFLVTSGQDFYSNIHASFAQVIDSNCLFPVADKTAKLCK